MTIPFRFNERPQHYSSSVNPAQVTRRYFASGQDRSYTLAYAVSVTPTTIVDPVVGTLYRQDIQLNETSPYTFDVTVPYGPKGEIAASQGQWRFSFDTSGGTVHVKTSKESIARFPADATNPNKQLIGWHGSEVDGVDVIIPALKISVSYKHPQAVITLPRVKYLASITGTVNSATFLGFAAGEVLFLGCGGSEGTDSETEVTYQFACSGNATGLTIGTISGIAKKGHEVAWIKYKASTQAGWPLVEPETIYIERVYDLTDLATALGFG